MSRIQSKEQFQPSTIRPLTTAAEGGAPVMRYFPAFLDLADRDVLVVGGGHIAARKVQLLRDAGARVSVVAKRLVPDLAENDQLKVVRRGFVAGDVQGKALVIAATDDREVNRRVAEAGATVGVPVNVVDDAALSSFIVPAIVQRGEVVVAVSTGGASPVLARRIRARIEEALPARLGALAAFAHRLRSVIRARIADFGERRRVWEAVLDGPVAEAVLAGREREAESRLEKALSGKTARGSVALVGAGPGDPELLTLKAARLVQSADVIIHDKLVPPEALGHARRDAERIYVGKSRGNHTLPQEEINHLIAHHARRGRRVVRLKGGDPFIFGRGGEELEHLRTQGIEVEIVPGVTAATACAAAASIPLTHRGIAEAVVLVTGQGSRGAPTIDWAALARLNQTIAVYMGVAAAPRIAAELTQAGLDPATPLAIVENATLPQQRAFHGTLAELPALISENRVEGPAIILIGAVAALALAEAAPDEVALAG
ncbi:MAG TPA: siroheme synthase CysG [Alphaproteobacteria bacterium]|nr:siroheme synthase CysG [Alphaproteobacteria bacterium]